MPFNPEKMPEPELPPEQKEEEMPTIKERAEKAEREKVKVGEFTIWPDSTSGARSNALRIERGEEGDEILVLNSNPGDEFFGRWSGYGDPIESESFEKLTPQEKEWLQSIGTNLPAGGLPAFAKPILEDRIDMIGRDNLEKTLEKVFELSKARVEKREKEFRKKKGPRLPWRKK